MFEFLMQNNEQAASQINSYRAEQEKKTSQILNYYKSYLKTADMSKDILVDKDESNLTRLNNQVKLVDSINEVISMRINMIL